MHSILKHTQIQGQCLFTLKVLRHEQYFQISKISRINKFDVYGNPGDEYKRFSQLLIHSITVCLLDSIVNGFDSIKNLIQRGSKQQKKRSPSYQQVERC